jgi:hypothetical protein
MLLFQSIFNKGAVNIPSLLSHITLCHPIISNKLTVCFTMKLTLSTETPPYPSWSTATTCIYKPTTPSTCTSTTKMEAAHSQKCQQCIPLPPDSTPKTGISVTTLYSIHKGGKANTCVA